MAQSCSPPSTPLLDLLLFDPALQNRALATSAAPGVLNNHTNPESHKQRDKMYQVIVAHLFMEDVPTGRDEDEADEYVEHADGQTRLQDATI